MLTFRQSEWPLSIEAYLIFNFWPYRFYKSFIHARCIPEQPTVKAWIRVLLLGSEKAGKLIECAWLGDSG